MCLTLKYQLDLEVTVVKYAICTSPRGILHLCHVIPIGQQSSRVMERPRYIVIQFLTLNYDIDVNDLGQTYALHIDSSYLTFELIVNLIRGSTYIERAQNRNGQTNRHTEKRTDKRTDNGANIILVCSSFHGQ